MSGDAPESEDAAVSDQGVPTARAIEDAEGVEDAEGAHGTSFHPITLNDLEALLFVAERPLTRRELAGICGLHQEAVDGLLGDLEVSLAQRGIRLVSSGDRVELATAPECGTLIGRYLGADELRLSTAALETLAIVAYRQPVTKGVIERIRGVDSDHVVRGLLHRRLIVEQGRADSPGRPILYGTSLEFMERFGLASLDDLPALEADVAAGITAAEMEAGAPQEVRAEEPTGDA